MGIWQYYLAVIAKILLVSYFFKAGINNLVNFPKMVNVIRNKKIPLPRLTMTITVIIEILGSIAIVFNIYAYIAAVLLALFTILVNFYFCNYWTMQGLDKRNVGFLFYANIAVIGGLLLILVAI